MGRCVVCPTIGLISFSADDSLYASTGLFAFVLDSVLVSTDIVGDDVEMCICCTVDGAVVVVVVALDTTL